MSTIDVSAGRDSALAAARDFAEELASDESATSRRAAADLVEETTRAVRGLRARVGLSTADVQDAIGETLLELVKRVDRGHPVQGAVVQHIATTVCSRFVNGPVRHETAKALRLLKERVAAAEAELGRALSKRAVATLAEEVRVGPDFNPRHRPVEGFHLVEGFTKPTSIDQQLADFIDVMRLRSGDANERGYAGAAGACDRLLDEVEVGAVSRAEARTELWGAIAADEGLPDAQPGRVSRRVAAALRAYATALPDGILAACRDHLDGRVSRATIAMFAPFDDPGPLERDEIARYLSARPVFATRLWESALARAASERPRGVAPADAAFTLLPIPLPSGPRAGVPAELSAEW